ncbi:MAG TPA: 50S ribosomal protein L32e [Candidatus Acidoferrales bacterium]|nr:50S ribosomal protein L32e [Candidatus Acidoferrales bacterium]
MSYPRPRFRREESWRYKRVKEAWRSPRGKTSRIRRSKNGWPPVVKIGYSRPKARRGKHPSGLSEVIVHRPKDLEKLDPQKQAARIAHTVGENKRVQILEDAKKANITVLNPGLKKSEKAIAEAPAEPSTEKETATAVEETTSATEREETTKTAENTEETEAETTEEKPNKQSAENKKEESSE